MTDENNDLDKRQLARLIAVGVLVVVLLAFVIDNTQSVRVGFVFFERNPPLIWILVVTAAVGAAIDRLVRWRRNR
ncbi:MAG TPA: LapA family protein [Acidimicrobiales bacterium]|nr:LapA family protein [Acidimicrobiales bacterium]